jgi:hypothetical protein
MRSVTRSHARQRVVHSAGVGMLPLQAAELGALDEENLNEGVDERGGKTTVGRSRTWSVWLFGH